MVFTLQFVKVTYGIDSESKLMNLWDKSHLIVLYDLLKFIVGFNLLIFF